MIELLLIVLPSALVATGGVLLAQRLGWLPTVEGRTKGPETAPQGYGRSHAGVTRTSSYRPVRERPRASELHVIGTVAIFLMASWIVLWITVLIVGLHLILQAAS